MPFAGEPFAGEMSGPGNATRTGFAGAPFAGAPFAGQTVPAVQEEPQSEPQEGAPGGQDQPVDAGDEGAGYLAPEPAAQPDAPGHPA